MDRRKNSSIIWAYFTIIDAERKLATCDICSLHMSYRGTISNLKNHLIRKHPTVNLSLGAKLYKSIPTDEQFNGSSLTYIEQPSSSESTELNKPSISVLQPNYTSQPSATNHIETKIGISQKKEIDQLLLGLFTKDFQPFSIVDDEGFKAFVKALDPSYELPSRKEISNNLIPAVYEECRTEIRNKMEDIVRVCLTTDCWSSSNDSYLALTAHFINDNFQLESILLDCLPIEGSPTSENLAETIKEITDNYGLSEKVLIVVSDNAANIVGAVDQLNLTHYGCFAHTINFIVNLALESVQDILDKARLIVIYLNRIDLATERLLKFQKHSGDDDPKELIEDVTTRWNSTFLMLQRLVLLRDAVETSLEGGKNSLNLTPEEWEMCRELVEVLEPFESVTQQMSEEKFVTGSQVIVLTAGFTYVCSVLKTKPYSPAVQKVVGTLHEGILQRFESVELHETLGVCTLLDPRFKQYAFSSKIAMEQAKEIVTKLAVQEYEMDREEPLEEVEYKPAVKKEKQELSIWGYFEEKIENLPQTSTSCPATLEVQRYLQESVIGRKEDPLKWWQENFDLYPYLAKIVKRYFPMVASSVPCERIFSKEWLLMNDRRTRLERKKVQHLMFLKENSYDMLLSVKCIFDL